MPAEIVTLLDDELLKTTTPVAFSPTFFLPVAENSTLTSLANSFFTDLMTLDFAFVEAVSFKLTVSLTVTLVVFAEIITVACGANQIAQTYGKGKYRRSAVSIFMRHEDGSVPSSDEMTHALCLAAKRGVDVRIITPGIPDKKMIFINLSNTCSMTCFNIIFINI